MKKTVHVAEVLSEGGRDGRIFTPSGSLDLSLSTASRPEAVTPEHLFAGAYAACFFAAMQNAAKRSHCFIEGLTVMAQVSLIEDEQGAFFLHVRMRAAVPGMDRHRAEHLMHLAHQSSPYSSAIHGNVDVVLGTD
ncbi:MAG TPA: Ohr family peroxiredoxin [Lacunisphaera sp.]